MSKAAPDVLARKVIPAGKVFIKAGEENSQAYVIQVGQVRAFVEEGGQKIEVDMHGPGTIIGEVCLVLDIAMPISYETVVDTTVATVTRQDFQKKLTRVDNTVRTIFTHLTHKLLTQDSVALDKARKRAVIDEQAFQLVRSLTSGMDDARKRKYEDKILPHVNSLIKTIKELKTGERHEKQAQVIKEKIEEIQSED